MSGGLAQKPTARGEHRTLPHDDIRAIAEVTAALVAKSLEERVLSKDEIVQLIADQTKDLVAVACKEAVHETFAQLGLDIKGDNRSELMRDFLFVREWRKFFADGKRHAWFAFLTACVGGVGMAVLTYLRSTGR